MVRLGLECLAVRFLHFSLNFFVPSIKYLIEGRSWTVNWLHFDNSYYKNVLDSCKGSGDKELLVLPTDAALYECPEFR